MVTHYLYGGIRLQTPGDRTTPAARRTLSVLLGIFMLLKAAAYWLDRYELRGPGRPAAHRGCSYTDANAVLPAKNILVVIALVCAAAVLHQRVPPHLVAARARASALLAASRRSLIGVVYPAIVQQFQVRPTEPARGAARTSSATSSRPARPTASTTSQSHRLQRPSRPPTAATLAAAPSTTENIRLLDPALVSPTYRQLQQIRGYYAFPDTLDVDRYEIDGASATP